MRRRRERRSRSPRGRPARLAGLLALAHLVAVAGHAAALCSDFVAPAATLAADDRDGDGRHTGNDIALALQACAARSGCVLRLLPVTYDDVNILISPPSHWCRSGPYLHCLDLRFPDGLVIEGAGSQTVLRSPLWTTPYHPTSLLEIHDARDWKLMLSDFVLDGRKNEQPDPTPGKNDAMAWWHYGFALWNPTLKPDWFSEGGCIRNLEIRGFMNRGLAFSNLRGWSIQDNHVHDIGCFQGRTDCDALSITGVIGPMRTENPAFVSPGAGILVGANVEDTVIQRNRIERATKYSIGIKHGSAGDRETIARLRVLENRITDAGGIAIFVAGVRDVLIQGNLIDSTRVLPEPLALAAYNNTMALSLMGQASQLQVVGNQILNSAGVAINYAVQGSGNLIADNEIRGSCREKGPKRCSHPRNPNPGQRGCYLYEEIRIDGSLPGDLELRNSRPSRSRCVRPLGVLGNPPHRLRLTVDGKRYPAGGSGAAR